MGDPASVLGQSVGPYRIVSFLGEGGMAEVFIGEHAQIGRQVAIKVLMAELCQSREVVERFMNEARALGRISHPNVVEVYDVGRLENGRVCLVMELLRGDPLSRMLARRGRLPVGEAVEIASQIAAAMAAAHERKIIHRDLKPDNVFVHQEPDGTRVKVLDFGVAKLLDGAGAVATATKTALGTAAYMSPEQFKSSRAVDHRCDIYALGCVLFELLSGAPPYPRKNLAQQMLAHATEPIPSARALNPEVPAALDEVLAHLLAKTPDERFDSMIAARNALAGAIGVAPPPTHSGAIPALPDELAGGPPPPATGARGPGAAAAPGPATAQVDRAATEHVARAAGGRTWLVVVALLALAAAAAAVTLALR